MKLPFFFEVSARDGSGIDELWKKFTSETLSRADNPQPFDDEDPEEEKKGGGCPCAVM